MKKVILPIFDSKETITTDTCETNKLHVREGKINGECSVLCRYNNTYYWLYRTCDSIATIGLTLKAVLGASLRDNYNVYQFDNYNDFAKWLFERNNQ